MYLADMVCILSENTFPDCTERLSVLEKPGTGKRIYFDYSYTSQYWNGALKYMPPMTKYVVEGDVRDLSAWSNSYIEYSAGTSRRLPKAEPYSLKDVIDFSVAGKSSSYIQRGWSVQEPTHRWTDGPRAGLMLDVQDTKGKDLLLRLKAMAYLVDERSYQTIGVVVNGQKVANWQMKDLGWYETAIPSNLVGKDGLLKIVFTISNPIAPCEVSKSSDCRKLGIDARELVIVHKHDNS
jgi:hypothetical protein